MASESNETSDRLRCHVCKRTTEELRHWTIYANGIVCGKCTNNLGEAVLEVSEDTPTGTTILIAAVKTHRELAAEVSIGNP